MDINGLPALELEGQFKGGQITIASVPLTETTKTREINDNVTLLAEKLKNKSIESLEELDDALRAYHDRNKPNQKMILMAISILWLKALARLNRQPVYKYLASVTQHPRLITPRLIKHINVDGQKILLINQGHQTIRKVIDEWNRIDRVYTNILNNSWGSDDIHQKIIREIISRPSLEIGAEGLLDSISKPLIIHSSLLANVAPREDWKTLSEIKKLYGKKKLIAGDYSGHKTEHAFISAGIFNPYRFSSIGKLVDSVNRAHHLGQKVIIRPGVRQTEDPITADLALGLGVEYFDLTNDYIYYPLVNKLIRIEEDISHG